MSDLTITTSFGLFPRVVPPLVDNAPRFVVPMWSRLRLSDAGEQSSHMWSDTYQEHSGPPTNRLWDEDDLAAYVGFRSIDELMARHPDFPSAVPLGMQGRRWRPGDIIEWIDHLCSKRAVAPSQSVTTPKTRRATRASSEPVDIPAFDMSLISEQLREASRG